MRPVAATLRRWGNALLDLLYPRSCLVCQRALVQGEKHICLHCLHTLPRTDYHLVKNNAVAQLFYGKATLQNAFGWFFYTKGSPYRSLIYAIKYHNEQRAAHYLGWLYGKELVASGIYIDIDYIVPIPLHPFRKWKRGYNQSELIANGIAEALGATVQTSWVKRTKNTASQTQKSVYERWHNTQSVFQLSPQHQFVNKKILIVDDVITTGATLLACAQLLEEVEGVEISILSLAVAN